MVIGCFWSNKYQDYFWCQISLWPYVISGTVKRKYPLQMGVMRLERLF